MKEKNLIIHVLCDQIFPFLARVAKALDLDFFFNSCVLYPKIFPDFPYFQILSPPLIPDGIVYNISHFDPQ